MRKLLPQTLSDILRVVRRVRRYASMQNPDPFEWHYALTSKGLPESEAEPVEMYISSGPWRLLVLGTLAIGVGLLLTGRLASLQLIHGAEYRQRSDGNRILLRTRNAPRGVIYDRYRTVLARNTPGFRQQPQDGTSSALVLTYEEALKQAVATDSAEVEIDALRVYQEQSLAHTIGYVSEVSPEELAKEPDLHLGDRVGRTGLEATYEHVLRGKPGKDLIEVNAQGKELRLLKSQPEVGGHALLTTIDAQLQATLSASLQEKMMEVGGSGAAAVVLQPRTGEVLALLSLPSFDPHHFTIPAPGAVEKVLNDPTFPLLHRAVAAAYPPGSTFKLMTALAALQTKAVTRDTLVEDTGELFLGPYRFPNWYFVQYGRTEGLVNITRALARSNDIYFYKAAEWTTAEALARLANMVGLPAKTGIDIPGEVEGLVPDEEWKRRVKKEPWLPGNTYHVGIGQGDVLATPLQIAHLTALVATKGIKATPHVAQGVIDGQGSLHELTFPQRTITEIDEEHWKTVREGMRQACDEGGTGWPFFTFPIEVGCKTGTAEYGRAGASHAWFTVFAPYDDPEIVVTVLIESGGEGSSVSAPVARKVLDWWVAHRR